MEGGEKYLLHKCSSSLADILHILRTDFTVIATGNVWNGSAVIDGASDYPGGSARHPGVISYKTSATANSGYKNVMLTNSILLAGGEKSTIIFKTATQQNGVTRRIGFHNTNTSTQPSDGVYVKVDGADGTELTGQCVNASSISTTATHVHLSADTWYKCVIELNSSATLATFRICNDSDELLWSDTLATNIPTTRNVGHGDVCTMASPSGATVIGSIDYMDIILPNARRI